MATSATAGGPGAHGKQAGEAAFGLCYGSKTSRPLTAAEVVEIYRNLGMSRMFLSSTPLSPKDDVISNIPSLVMQDSDLRSKMKIVMCIDYKDLSPLAKYAGALEWVRTYVARYASVISHVCVGDVSGSVDFSIPIFKGAMSYLKKLLPETVKLSVLVNESMLLGLAYTGSTYPSRCNIETPRFTDILRFLSELLDYPIPLFVRIMPYFRISSEVPVKNCILNREASIYMNDTVNESSYSYSQAFDAMLDSICCALKKVGGLPKVDIHVVTGWPTGPVTAPYASAQYARDYFSNLRQRIRNPTPMKNKPVEVFIYSMEDEDLLEAPEEEFKHLGAAPYLQSG